MEAYMFRYNGENFLVHFEISSKYALEWRIIMRDNQIVFCAGPLVSRERLISIIQKHKRGLANMYKRAQRVSEDSIYIFGENRKIKFENGIYSIEATGSYKNEEEKINLLKRLLNRYIDSRFLTLAKQMNVTHDYSYSIRDMKTRFGTNSWQTDNIAFSVGLVHFSYEIIDSVIIHELAHDFYRDHSKSFYKVVYKYCPNYDELRQKMVNGQFK